MQFVLERCTIRPWRLEDAESLAKHANNRKVWIALRDLFPHPYTIQDADEFLQRAISEQRTTKFCAEVEGVGAGGIGIRLGQDVNRHTAGLGYWLDDDFRGRGIMTDAVAAFTDFCFERIVHTAVWTGSEMIVWGRWYISGPTYLNTGGIYNPITDSWTATAFTPSQRDSHKAVWTGNEMIVWGGIFDFQSLLNTSSRYHPTTDSWHATSLTNVPEGRDAYSLVWTGSEMIVWGGLGETNFLNNGGRYNPVTDSWTITSTTNAPIPRYNHTAVWTGNEMIIWGGYAGSFGNTTVTNTGATPVRDTARNQARRQRLRRLQRQQ